MEHRAGDALAAPSARRQEGGEEMSDAWIMGLDAQCEPQLVGGKVAGLYELTRAGLSVPYGFCVSVAAFEHVLAKVLPTAASLAELQQKLREATLPAKLERQIEQLLEAYPDHQWAVRSSAIEEDGLLRSFAGQQLTCLNLTTSQQVIDAIKVVWASLYAPETLLYRERLNVSLVPSGIAVLVQLMVSPACAGVLFTSDPMNASAEEMVISAVRGLGLGVVEGRAQDTYYIDRKTGYLKSRSLAQGHDSPVLDDDRLKQLVAVGRQLHERFGRAMDVEWAFDQADQSLRLLQLRPVTALETSNAARERLTVWSNANVGEALPGVGTPLTWSIIRGFSKRGFEQAFGALGLDVPEDNRLVESFRGRVYLNLTEFMSIASAIPILNASMLFSMAGGGGLETVEQTYERRSATEFLLRLPLTIPKVLLSQGLMPWGAPLWARYFKHQCEAFFGRELERLHPGQLYEQLLQVDKLFERNGLVMLSCSANFLMSFVFLHESLKFLGGERALDYEHALVSALGVKSAEPGLDLLKLGRLARRSMRLRELLSSGDAASLYDELKAYAHEEPVAQFLDALEAFRRAHGHRAPREAELLTPRWREDVSFIFEVVRSFIDSTHLPTVQEIAKERREQFEAAYQDVRAMLWPGFRPMFDQLLTLTRDNARRREELRALVVDSLDMYRRLYKECGRRMVKSGLLNQEDDIFFLHTEEIQAWFEDTNVASGYRLKVLARRAIFELHRGQPDPPQTFVLKDREIIAEEDFLAQQASPGSPQPGEHYSVYGLPGAAGKTTGIACVMHELGQDGASLKPGEILVVPFADVGWTPLFLSAKAVVMGLGGPLSHACIVAREYGIPTVVNARGATQRIMSGDKITVDGDKGVVYIVERAAQPEQAPSACEALTSP